MNDECVSTVHTDINDIEAKNYILANDESYKKH